MMNQAGTLSPELTRKSMKLFADEVYPQLKELAPVTLRPGQFSASTGELARGPRA